MQRQIAYFVFILTIFSSALVSAQVGLDPKKSLDQYNVEHLTSEEGLPDDAIIHIIQSKIGYIWFVSYGGITRFDGVDFKTYSSYNTPEIVNNSFTHIFEDSQGVIWASNSGNGIISISDQQVNAYTSEDGLPTNFIEEVTQTKDGRIWVATGKGLVYLKDSIFVNEGIPDVLKHQTLTNIDCDANNNLWLATSNNGVYQLDDKGVLVHYNTSNGLVGNRIITLKSQKGKVTVGTNSGLSIIDNGKITNLNIESGLPNNKVTSIHIDNNGIIYIGTYSGFCRFDGRNINLISPNHSMYGADITSIMGDSEGNLWLSTYRRGLYKFWEGKFTNYSAPNYEENKPFTVHAVIERNPDDVILVIQEGIYQITPSKNLVTPLEIQLDATYQYKSGMLDSKNRLWLGTNYGVLIYDQGKVTSYFDKYNFESNFVRVIYEDSQQRFWVGSQYGLILFNESTNESSYFTTNEGLAGDYIMHLIEDYQNNIWVAMRTGLSRITDDGIESFHVDDGLAGDFIFKLYEDKDSLLWIGGNAGLTRFKDDKFTKITSKDGLFANTIVQILEDDLGYFWFTTNQKGTSMFKVLKQELNDFCEGKITHVNSIQYTQHDGIKANAATSSSISIKASDGKLWFATHQGAEVIDPHNIEINKYKPPAVIEAVKLNNKEMDLAKPIIIHAGKQRISFKFTGLSFIASENVLLKYQLVGYDENWIVADQTRETSYTNLTSGKYTFKVMAANSDGVWNEEATFIDIKVLPFFYNTWWFYSACILFFLSIIYLYLKWKTINIRNRSAQLEKTVKERTLQLEQKSIETETLYDLSTNLIAPIGLDLLLKSIVEGAVALVSNAQTGSILLLNSTDHVLEGKVAFGIPDELIKNLRIKVGEGQSGKAVAENRNIIENNLEEDYIVKHSIFEKSTPPIKSIIVVLLKTNEKILGTISLDNHDQFDAFSQHDLDILSSLSANASVAIEREKMFRQHEEQIEIIQQSEAKLIENQNRFKDAFSLSRMAIWEHDFINQRTLLNEEFCDILGIEFNENKPYFENDEFLQQFVHSSDKSYFRKVHSKALNSNDIDYQDIVNYRILKPSGELVWLHSTIRLKFNKNGLISSFYGTCQDITEIKKYEEDLIAKANELKAQSEELRATNDRLVELDEYKEAMTAMIVHDFKNSLNTVISFSEGKPTERRLRSIRQAGQFMLNMVLNILDVQKFETTEVKLAQSNNPITELINEAISQLNYMIEQKSINITSSVDPGAISRFDFELTVRVVVNILSNAIKFVPTNGVITISTQAQGDFIQLAIKDNGPGIPPDKLHMVFDKFSQLNAQKSGSIRSTGIGLTFCKLVVEAQRGEIGVISEEGTGSTFFFTLPIVHQEEENKPTSTIKTAIARSEDALHLAEDDIKLLSPYINELKEWEVYDYSEVTAIIENVKADNSNIKSWKAQLLKALQNVNEEQYINLISIK